MNRPTFSFRPNLENSEHRRAWEILKTVPEGQKNAYLVRAILHEDQTFRLEEMLRTTVREELRRNRQEEISRKTVRKDRKMTRIEKVPATARKEVQDSEIPAQMLEFLSRME